MSQYRKGVRCDFNSRGLEQATADFFGTFVKQILRKESGITGSRNSWCVVRVKDGVLEKLLDTRKDGYRAVRRDLALVQVLLSHIKNFFGHCSKDAGSYREQLSVPLYRCDSLWRRRFYRVDMNTLLAYAYSVHGGSAGQLHIKHPVYGSRMFYSKSRWH